MSLNYNEQRITDDKHNSVNVNMIGNVKANATEQSSDTSVMTFGQHYAEIRVPLVSGLCTLGLLVNIANMLFIRRRNMLPGVHVALIALAISHVTILATRLSFSLMNKPGGSRAWMNLVELFHVADPSLDVASLGIQALIGLYRYVILYKPKPTSRRLCNRKKAIRLVGLIYLICLGLSMPQIISPLICSSELLRDAASCLGKNDTTAHSGQILMKTNLWLLHVMARLGGTCAVFVTGGFLVAALRRSSRGRHKLSTRGNIKKRSTPSAKSRFRNDLILLVTLLLLLLAEGPKGILLLHSLLRKRPDAYQYLYLPLEPFFEDLEFPHHCLNLMLNNAMHPRYRRALKNLFTLRLGWSACRAERVRRTNRQQLELICNSTTAQTGHIVGLAWHRMSYSSALTSETGSTRKPYSRQLEVLCASRKSRSGSMRVRSSRLKPNSTSAHTSERYVPNGWIRGPMLRKSRTTMTPRPTSRSSQELPSIVISEPSPKVQSRSSPPINPPVKSRQNCSGNVYGDVRCSDVEDTPLLTLSPCAPVVLSSKAIVHQEDSIMADSTVSATETCPNAPDNMTEERHCSEQETPFSCVSHEHVLGLNGHLIVHSEHEEATLV